MNDPSVRNLIDRSFVHELEPAGNIIEQARLQWSKLEFTNVRALISPIYLIGYTTTQNTKVFVFEKTNANLRSRNNLSVEVIALGDLPVEKILNYAFMQIRSILKPLSLQCKHIDDARIYIYPYDTSTKDIYSPELKIRADLKSKFVASRFEYVKWMIIFAIVCISFVMFFTVDPAITSTMKSIYLSLLCSGVFILLQDAIVFFLVPFLTQSGYKRVEIKNLSSVVETSSLLDVSKNSDLVVPQ